MVGQNHFLERSSMKTVSCNVGLNRLKCFCKVTVTRICVIAHFMNHFYNFVFFKSFFRQHVS